MTTCIAITLACVLAGGEPRETVRPIIDVQAMSADGETSKPTVRIRGLITSSRRKTGVDWLLTVEDESAATWIRVPWHVGKPVRAALAAGTEIEAEGTLDPGGFAPRIVARDLAVIGKKPLPEPRPADIDRLFAGGDNARRVVVRAVVQGYRTPGESVAQLIVASESRRFVANVPAALLRDDPKGLIDASVRLTGIVMAVRNTRGEFLAPEIHVNEVGDVQVIEPPRGGPFESREISLSAIGRLRPDGDWSRRVKTRGTVTAAFPGDVFYLQHGDDGIRVQARAGHRVARGDEVEVAGFVDMSRGVGMLCEAVCRHVGGGEPLRPVPIQPARIVSINTTARRSRKIAKPGSYNGCLIIFEGRHIESHAPHDGWCRMTVMDGATSVTVTVPEADYPTIAAIEPGSLVHCTGVADLKSSAVWPPLDADPVVEQVDVLVANSADVVVVRRPSWWSPRRLGIALAAAIGTTAAALIVIHLMRRRIVHQAERIADQIRSGREASLEFEAVLRERNRLASNLHDTVLQTVAGIGFQLRACRTASEHDEESLTQHLELAEQMVEHAVQQLRGNVWALHATSKTQSSLVASLQAAVDRLRDGHSHRIDVRSEGAERDVPDTVAGNLMLVTQEAILNAVRHGQATVVDVKAVFGDDGGVAVVIRDDGVGFAPGRQPGAEQGHFGLDGMRDRMQRMGGSIEVLSEPGEGTRVTARIPANHGSAPVPKGSVAASVGG